MKRKNKLRNINVIITKNMMQNNRGTGGGEIIFFKLNDLKYKEEIS